MRLRNRAVREGQQIGMGRAVYYDPDVFLLDEATSTLDKGTDRELARGGTVTGRQHNQYRYASAFNSKNLLCDLCR